MATPRRPQQPKKSGFLATVFVVGILGGLVWLVMLIFGIGPYAVDEVKPTADATLIAILPPNTEITLVPTITQTLAATDTLVPVLTPTVTASATPEAYPFILIGEPESMSSDLLRPSLGCGWLVIAGQVWDLQDAAVKGFSVQLFGELEGFLIDQFSVTGSAPVYGESGYEFLLQNLVVNSQNSLFIQLEDENGVPYSLPYALETFNDCQKNLILVNFKQVR